MKLTYKWEVNNVEVGTGSLEIGRNDVCAIVSYAYCCSRCGRVKIRATCDLGPDKWSFVRYVCHSCLRPDDSFHPHPLCTTGQRLLPAIPEGGLLDGEFLACMSNPDGYFYWPYI